MSKLDVANVPAHVGSSYPAPFDEPIRTRRARRLGSAAGLTQFGVNLIELPPGSWSSQRHWHSHEDEFVYVLVGEVCLVTDAGEQVLGSGDCAGFPAGTRDGHHFINRSDAAATLLVVGSRNDEDHGEYPDIDMTFGPNRYTQGGTYRRKDGTPYGQK